MAPRTGWSGAVLFLLVTPILADPVAGQDPAAPDRRPICWTARPLEACRGFLLFSLRGNLVASQSTRTIRTEPLDPRSTIPSRALPMELFESSVGWELGAALNVSERYAVGATFGIDLGPDRGEPLLGRLHLRRWLGEGRGEIELASGIVSVGREVGDRSIGFTGELRVGHAAFGYAGLRYDRVHLDRVEDVFPVERRIDPGGTQHALFLTAGLTELPGLWGSGALVTGFLIFAALYASLVGGT